MRLVVQASRFFCKDLSCSRKTFAEAIPAVADRYARRTIRLKEVLEHLGLALGGEAASRLTCILGMHCSPDTLLRLLRRLPDNPHNMARIYRELTTKGYKGSYESVRNLLISLRQGDRHSPLHSGIPISARQATWLFLRRPEELTIEEQETIAQLCNLDPQVNVAYDFVQQFRCVRLRFSSENSSPAPWSNGNRWYRRAAFDFRTDTPLATSEERAPLNAVLLFDGVFLLRPELDPLWDYRIFVQVDFAVALQRAMKRDRPLFGTAEAVGACYLQRYIPGQQF